MTNSIKITPQRTSFILSVSVILYWATDSYLYLSCHINLMEYSTPVILYITAMILACVNPEKPDVPLNKNDAFQKVQKRRVQEKR